MSALNDFICLWVFVFFGVQLLFFFPSLTHQRSYRVDVEIFFAQPCLIRVDRNSIHLKKGEMNNFRFLVKSGLMLLLLLFQTTILIQSWKFCSISISDVKSHRSKKGMFHLKVTPTSGAPAKAIPLFVFVVYELKENKPRKDYKVRIGSWWSTMSNVCLTTSI